MSEYEYEYDEYLKSIDVSVAGSDNFGDLRWHVDCSSLANIDEFVEADEWVQALNTAKMIMDCWEDFYPQLIKEKG